MSDIHPTSIIEDGAQLGENVFIGPFCSIGADVVLEDGVRMISHAVVAGRTIIGPNTHIYPFASIGHQPQDLKYQGELSSLEIGANNIIREHVTMNPGTEGGGMVTRVGNNCLFMVGAHIAHDCDVGNHAIFANNATLAGHVIVEDYAVLGGLSAVHQFVRMSGVEHDVIPYGSVLGNRARLAGLNIVGLRRRKFSRGEIADLRKAYRLLFAEEGSMAERVNDASEMYKDNRAVMDIVEFIRVDSSRSICQPRTEHGG
jgi:UDP-N-acetylglucosamine acyltransferase